MFVRAIDAVTTIEKITENSLDTPIGIISLELRSKDDTLSMWYIDDIAHLDDAILSFILTRSDIAKGAFIIIDDALLARHNIDHKYVKPDCIIPLIDSHAIHFNMYGIKLNNTKNVLDMYKEILKNESHETSDDGVFIKNYTYEQIKGIIKTALVNDKVDICMLGKNFRKLVDNPKAN